MKGFVGEVFGGLLEDGQPFPTGAGARNLVNDAGNFRSELVALLRNSNKVGSYQSTPRKKPYLS